MDLEIHYAHANGFAKSPQQHSLNLGFFSCPTDVAAPDPDYFDSDLDSVLVGLNPEDIPIHAFTSNDFSHLRSNTPGPLSNITFSNESYDSLSSHSESIYNFPTAHSVYSAYSSPTDITMEFSRFNVDSDYAGAQSNINMDDADPTSFGTLPPTPPRSPPVSLLVKSDKNYHRGSYPDYSSPRRSSGTSSDYYSLSFAALTPTISPAHVSAQLPSAPSNVSSRHQDEYNGDSKRKYKCHLCPRAFARAYNLKTHMGTHDPNRPKPHVCPHRNCGRSFSRKHDLGRHLISIHRDDSVCSMQSISMKKSIGVDKANRSWCDGCGKGWIGRPTECDCK